MSSPSGSSKPVKVPKFLSSHLPPASSCSYLLTPTLSESFKLSLFSQLLDSIPTSSHLLPRQVAPSNQHALNYFKQNGYSLPKAQKAAQEELRRLKGKDKSRERDREGTLGLGSAFGNDAEVLGPEYGSDRKGMPCGHVFKEGEPIYRCRDCGLDDTCVQCAPCFNASDHAGHDIVFSISSQGGGCCDCGDEEAWVQRVRCSYHDNDVEPLNSSSSEINVIGSSSGSSSASYQSMLPDSNHLLTSDSKGKGIETMDSNPNPLASLLDPIPSQLHSSLSLEIQSLLEYVLQVLEHAPHNMNLPKGPDALESFKKLRSLEDLEDANESHDKGKGKGNSNVSLVSMDSDSENIEGSDRDAEDEEEDIFLDGEDEMQIQIQDLINDGGGDDEMEVEWQLAEAGNLVDFHSNETEGEVQPQTTLLEESANGNQIFATTGVVTVTGGVGGVPSWLGSPPVRPDYIAEAEPFLRVMREAQARDRERERETSVHPEEGAPSGFAFASGSNSNSNQVAGSPYDSQPTQVGFGGFGSPSNSNVTPQPPQTSSSFQPVDTNTSTSTPVQRSYSVILWNDEKHSFSEVIDTIKDASGVDERIAKEMAERVDKHGREIVETSTNLKQLFNLARRINHIDLAVTIRPSYDVFAEEVAGQVLNFLLDLSSAALYLPESNTGEGSDFLAAHPHEGFVTNASALRALITEAFLKPWSNNNPSVAAQGAMTTEFFDPTDLRNVDGLLLMDAKMWKEARSTTREVWLMIMGAKEVKKELAIRCAKMYPKMMETFILKDREQEHSICYMTVQLFSVPSIADHLVQTGFLQKLLQILQAVFTGHLSSGSLRLPPTPPPRGQASPQSMPLRQQRCYQSFYDLRYLLQASGVQSQLVSDPKHLQSLLDFLAYFNAITPDRRAVSAHVEFETDVWITVFHVSSQLGRAARLFGEAFKKAGSAQFERALEYATRRILLSSLALHSNDPGTHPPLAFYNASYGGQIYEIVEFSVENQPVSFHHPMHWLLAEMMKHVDLIDPDGLGTPSDTYPSAVAEVVMRNGSDSKGMLVLLDFPLRVIVKLAQIRVGLWVRNGYALRSQAHHYRDNSMREIMCDQDLYLLQCGFLLVDPSLFLVSIMDRFSLLDWFGSRDGSSQVPHKTYESDQRISMADEMLLLLITLLSEVSVAASWSLEKQVRREIIQFLALGQGTYSELVKNISERLTDHASFDRCLSQVAHFRSPDGTTDVGIFDLKEEFYEEVEPHFYHYTRNQREKAEEILCEKRKKKTGDTGVTVPKKLDIPSGPFKHILPKVFADPTLLSIIYSSLSDRSSEGEDEIPESLIESALHLLMLGLVEDDPTVQRKLLEGISTWIYSPTGNSQLDLNEANSINQFTLLRLISSWEESSKFKAFKPKISWILNKIMQNERTVTGGSGFASAVLNKWRNSEFKGNEEKDGNKAAEDRKAAAKARQAAIMQQFSAQQASLLASLDDDEDEDEEESYDEMEGLEGEDIKPEAAPKRSLGSCILCQENLDGSQAFGSLAHVQSSRLIRTTPPQDAGYLQQSLVSPLTLDQNSTDGKRVKGPDAFSSNPTATSTSSKGLFPLEDHRFGFHASTCGHLMHLGCFQSYCRSVEQRQGQQIARNHPEDLSRCEFVCPLCKSLGNVILPVPGVNSHSNPGLTSTEQLLHQLQAPQMSETPLGDWIRKINIDILKCSTSSQGAEHQETEFGTGSFLAWFAEEQYGAFVNNDWTKMADKVDGPTIQMIARLLQALKPLSAEARPERNALRNRTILAPPSRNMYMPEELVAYTVSVLEISQRGIALNPSNVGSDPLSGTIADSISDQTVQLLRSLLHCMRSLAVVGKAGGSAMASLREGLLKRLLPQWGGDDAVRSPLLLRNPLTILIEAAILIPESIRQVTSLMFYATLVQAVFGLAQPSVWPQAHLHAQSQGLGAGLRAKDADSIDMETAKAIFPDARWTAANIIGFVGYARGNITLGVDNLDENSLAKLLCSYTLPFLRRAAIIHRVVGAFDSKNGGGGLNSFENGSGSEYVRLLDILKISPPVQGLPIRAEQQTPIAGLVEGWIKHGHDPLASLFKPLPIQSSSLSAQPFSFGSSRGNSPASGSASNNGFDSSNQGQTHLHSKESVPTLLLEHPHIYELVPLPVDLARLIQTTQSRKCKKCKNVPPEPALCLLCGDLVCFQSFCCEDSEDRRGECNIHLDKCGGSTGIFYRVKANVVLLLHQKNGTFTSSPYLDSHGEIDIGLRKGRPQKLQPQRYDELRKQWLAHGISNIVARKIEALMDQGGWDTF